MNLATMLTLSQNWARESTVSFATLTKDIVPMLDSILPVPRLV